MLVMGLAPILAPILGGQLLLFFDWRVIFVVLAVIGVVALGDRARALRSLPPR